MTIDAVGEPLIRWLDHGDHILIDSWLIEPGRQAFIIGDVAW
jgi:hypothetical protein